MAYFNHAFHKVFLGTGPANGQHLPTGVTTANISSVGCPTCTGYIATDNIPTVALTNINITNVDATHQIGPVGSGYFGIFSAATNETIGNSTVDGCCPFYIASSPNFKKDRIGPYAGGYRESNKSKIINPRYVRQFYRVDTCLPEQSVVSIGSTPGTISGGIRTTGAITLGTETYVTGTYTNVQLIGTGFTALGTVVVNGAGAVTAVTITTPGWGYSTPGTFTFNTAAAPSPQFTSGALDILAAGTDTTVAITGLTSVDDNHFQGGTNAAHCEFNFLCGETYYLRVDVKGSPALRFLNHQAYQTVSAYTGCCEGPDPVVTDPTLVMIQWAQAIHINPYIKDLVLPVVYDTNGDAWYAPNTLVNQFGATVTQAEWWTNYTSPAGPFDTLYAGLRLFGAYVETKFGNCTFQVTDFYETEPVKILASMVDYTGDPCTFEGICVYTDCYGLQGMGFGEKVLRDLIVSESYLQNYVGSGTDMRIREITQGYDIIDAIDRDRWYTRYFLLHSVPRYNNPTGVFDNDQYMLEIVVGPEVDPANPVGNPRFEDAMEEVLGACPDCLELTTRSCIPCVVNEDVFGR